MKTLIFFICILLAPTLFIYVGYLDNKGKKEIGIHPATEITEYQGAYYWRIRGEGPINTERERWIPLEQYAVYNSYNYKRKVLVIIAVILGFSSIFFAPSCLGIDRLKYGPYEGYRAKKLRKTGGG